MKATSLLLPSLFFLLVPGALNAQRLPLSEAVRRSLDAHPSVALAVAERDRASAMIGEAESARFPRVSAQWDAVRFQEPMIVAPLHGFDLAAPPEFDRLLLQGNVTAEWLLFDGGARGARIARASSAERAADDGIASAEASLITRVSQAYLAVWTARENALAESARVQALLAERDRVTQLEAEGSVAHVAVLRADAALSRARADSITNAATITHRESDLARFMGSSPEDVRATTLDTLRVAPQAYDRATLIARAMDNNPNIARAERQLEAVQASVREQRGSWLPAFGVGGRVNSYASGAGNHVAEWQAAFRVSYSLFTGGQRTSAIARAEAERHAAEQSLRIAQLEVEAGVDRALSALTEADARVDALVAAVTQFEEVVNIERLALDAGAGVQTDFLSAQSQLVEARTALAAAQAARALARIELANVTGELSIEWINTNVESL